MWLGCSGLWWPSIIIVKYVSFWGEKNKKWEDTKNVSNQNRKKGEKNILININDIKYKNICWQIKKQKKK